MKLLYCPRCQDVRKLDYLDDKQQPTYCKCKSSWGYYLPDGLFAVRGGMSIMLGFNNGSFQQAVINQPAGYGMGESFEAFVIPEPCETIRNEGQTPNPGSPEAVSLGCTCPILDNGHGKGSYSHGPGMFYFSSDCPIHSKEGV